MKILIADDELSSLKVVERMVSRWGYDVALAHDGLEAWKMLERDHTFHIAMLDWMMPGLSGLEICRRLRMRTEYPYVAVLVVTARAEPEDIEHGYAAGADDYLIKPVNAIQMKQRLTVAERMVRMERELRNSNETLSRLVSSLGPSQS
ncbi:MAG TPA: response regulator [Fibrobacteraceae bacterium]|nr:response regulator [Fibrobacteraceae bacterium]